MKTPLHFNPTHVFRSILREASYHPDPRARAWLKQHAITSFRKNRDKLLHDFPSWTKATRASRESGLLSRARKFQSLLRRANEGSVDHFRRTLNLAYGRRGPRRRQLMHKIMAAAPPAAPGESLYPNHPPSTTSLELHTPPKSATGPASPQFLALAKSQAPNAAYIPGQNRPIQVRGPKNELPTTTIWNRPMPESRIKRHIQKWYAKEADTVYPPLPREEWAYIRNIALGNVSLSVPPLRKLGTDGVLVEGGEWDQSQRWVDGDNIIIIINNNNSKEEEGDGDAMRWNTNLLAPLNRSLRQHTKKPIIANHSGRWLSRQYAWLLRHTPLAVDGRVADLSPDAAAEATGEGSKAQAHNNNNDKTTTAPTATDDINPEDKPQAQRKGKGQQKTADADEAIFLWDDAYTKTAYVKQRVTDPEMRRLLFG